MGRNRNTQVEFIVTQGPAVYDERTKFIIRQRASILAASSRTLGRRSSKTSTSRKQAVRQAVEDEDVIRIPTRKASRRQHTYTHPLSRTVFNSAYESARSKYGVDITDLASLVNGNICGMSTEQVASSSKWLKKVLDKSDWTYLEFVPSRYGYTDCLTKVTDCLMHRMYTTLIDEPAPHQIETEIRLHSMALRSMRDALADPEMSVSSDVLCAALLLSLYERLQRTGTSSWRHHIRGCALLVKHRKARSFVSEYDKALFLAHVEPVVFDAVTSDMHTHLEEQDWVDLHLSIAHDSEHLTSRHPLVIRDQAHLARICGLLSNFRRIVPDEKYLIDAARAGLAKQAEELHTGINACFEDYSKYCARTSDQDLSELELRARRDLLGSMMTVALVTKQFLIHTIACDQRRRQFKIDLHNLAEMLVENHRSSRFQGLFTKHELVFGESAIAAERSEIEDTSAMTKEQRLLMARRRYMAWSDATVARMPVIAA